MEITLNGLVIVITGASTGIGRATALHCSRLGGTVVLVSRRESALKRLASHCESLGAKTLVIALDVCDDQAVTALAKQVVETCGRIDVWINNAAASIFARIEDAPLDVYRKVIETNLFGCINGARAAIPYFREQKKGILINVSSILGKIGAPYLSTYVASMFAIIGLSRSLRMETMDIPELYVCTLLPASTDTPFFQHAANYTARVVKPTNPIYTAESVARAIVKLINKPQRELIVGSAGRIINAINSVAPSAAEKAYARYVEKEQFLNQAEPITAGNVNVPQDNFETVSGGWKLPIQANQSYKARRAWVGISAAGIGLLIMFARKALSSRHAMR